MQILPALETSYLLPVVKAASFKCLSPILGILSDRAILSPPLPLLMGKASKTEIELGRGKKVLSEVLGKGKRMGVTRANQGVEGEGKDKWLFPSSS